VPARISAASKHVLLAVAVIISPQAAATVVHPTARPAATAPTAPNVPPDTTSLLVDASPAPPKSTTATPTRLPPPAALAYRDSISATACASLAASYARLATGLTSGNAQPATPWRPSSTKCASPTTIWPTPNTNSTSPIHPQLPFYQEERLTATGIYTTDKVSPSRSAI
jgi:hypothetical protein